MTPYEQIEKQAASALHAAALAAGCPTCGAAPGKACRRLGGPRGGSPRGGFHKHRVKLATPSTPPTKPKCECTNHLGHPKAQHKTRQAAITWALRSTRKRGLAGMRFEPYHCPTSDSWHIRTARDTR